MLMRYCGLTTGALLLTVASATAGAASVSLNPTAATVLTGEAVSFDVAIDFTDEATFGGGIDFFFDDGVLQFESFTRNPALADEAFARRDPDVQPNELNGLAFGHSAGLGGTGVVGTLAFKALAPGITNIVLAANQGGPGNPGPFVSAVTFVEQGISFSGATVTVELTPIPLPPALPLLLSAVWTLGRSRRRGDPAG